MNSKLKTAQSVASWPNRECGFWRIRRENRRSKCRICNMDEEIAEEGWIREHSQYYVAQYNSKTYILSNALTTFCSSKIPITGYFILSTFVSDSTTKEDGLKIFCFCGRRRHTPAIIICSAIGNEQQE